MGTELICVKDAITDPEGLTSTFLDKYLKAQCTLSPIEGGLRYGVWMYDTTMTCGALSGAVKIAGGEDEVQISVKLSGNVGGVEVGKDASTKFNWQQVSDSCQ